MNLTQLFDLSFRQRGDAVALEWQAETLTFADVEARAARMAAELRARGVAPGDRVAVYLPNGLPFIDAYLAATRIGAICLPINILYRGHELAHILEDARPVAMVAARDQPPATEAACPIWWAEELDAAARHRAPEKTVASSDSDAPALLIYTSGTTGRAKGALLTHGNLVANAVALVVSWQITDRDRFLLALPLFHVHGLGNGLHSWLASGCRMRLLERFDRATIADDLLSFAPTLFFGVPTMYARLLEIDPEAAGRIGAAARLFVSGSAALPPQVFDAFRERFGHAVLERYGMSETLMTIGNPYCGERRAGAIGVPLPGVSVRLLDDAGHEVADGEVGELHVRGPTVFCGYWRDEEATRAAFVDGYFRTGDLASRDATGMFSLHGRRSDVIISGGFNIYPREIEDVLEQHPAVAEAAVTGVSDAIRGEVPVAFVVLRPTEGSPEALAADLTAFCRARLASFKTPRAFVPLEALPRNALGKVQKSRLPRHDLPAVE
jgi:malonyl-CoA/methylmalonyl-CoA synthetase